jgi:hypothetical protein
MEELKVYAGYTLLVVAFSIFTVVCFMMDPRACLVAFSTGTLSYASSPHPHTELARTYIHTVTGSPPPPPHQAPLTHTTRTTVQAAYKKVDET